MEYRVTKYDPGKRDSSGAYLVDEWTSICDVGKSVSMEEYERTERAYIDTAIELLKDSNCPGLNITIAEEIIKDPAPFIQGIFVELDDITSLFRLALREEVGYRFDNGSYFVVFGYDYYMYVGADTPAKSVIEKALNKGIYVEEYECPYKRNEC